MQLLSKALIWLQILDILLDFYIYYSEAYKSILLLDQQRWGNFGDSL